jgi:hypothetical protein
MAAPGSGAGAGATGCFGVRPSLARQKPLTGSTRRSRAGPDDARRKDQPRPRNRFWLRPRFWSSFAFEWRRRFDIAREPRNGRNFEYQGEDPILAGTMAGQLAKGVQAQDVIGDIKHFAFNDQETGRNIGNVVLDKRSMRETDLLALEIAIRTSGAGAVMCSYNKINGDYACENSYTLNDVLKKDWDFHGFVLSGWGRTHSRVKAALAGLDIEMPGSQYFGNALETAVQSGEVPIARLDDMVHRHKTDSTFRRYDIANEQDLRMAMEALERYRENSNADKTRTFGQK